MTLKSKFVKVSLPATVGKGYKDFWKCKKRYRVIKGSRASKKSKTIALWYIVNMMKYPEANLLVVRKVAKTLRDSCFSDLLWAINRLKVQDYWTSTVSPMEIVYKPTGQKIIFRGLDEPMKVTSVSVVNGYLCWLWIEEAYEIMKEEAFDTLDESIRGATPDELFKQITLSFNPWNERHWIKKRFFDKEDDTIFTATTNYLCNEWLDEADRKVFEAMKINNPRRYQVAGLGQWGVVDGLVYENWEEKDFDINKVLENKNIKTAFGLDFGYTNDPSAFFCGAIDLPGKIIYVFDEIYKTRMSNEQIFKEINNLGYSKESITADSAEPKSIDQLKGLGLHRIKGAKKGADSINNGVQFIQEFKLIIHPKCVNFLTEISNYSWAKDKFNTAINKPVDDFNHLMDAMRYALESYMRSKGIKTMDKSILGLR